VSGPTKLIFSIFLKFVSFIFQHEGFMILLQRLGLRGDCSRFLQSDIDCEKFKMEQTQGWNQAGQYLVKVMRVIKDFSY
jgi:hypothetical protein